MKDYFARNGVKAKQDDNPAEFMIDVVSGSLSKGKDWAKVRLSRSLPRSSKPRH
jgi:ATP-binding cassette subfamily G (WHITE) protein 2 (SNQ2)